MIEVEGLGEATPVAMHVQVFRDPLEDWCIRSAAGDGGQHISLMIWQYWHIAIESTFATLHMYQQLAGLVLVDIATFEITHLLAAQARCLQEFHECGPVRRLKMPIMVFGPTRAGNTGPGPARDSDCGSQFAI